MNPPASDKIPLFNGTDLSQWHRLNQPAVPAQWSASNGVMKVVPATPPTNIQTNMKFDDVCLHVEYMTPPYTAAQTGTNNLQDQGNSGVFLRSAYELQILDTSGAGPLLNGCGAIYEISKPMVVACHPFNVWNTYEIEFEAPVWDSASPTKKTKDARFVQVTLNGRLVQQNVSVNPPGGFTPAGVADAAGPQPLALQDHKQVVQFKNLWATLRR